MTCPNCPTVPVVSRALARAVVESLSLPLRRQALMAALEWLTARHSGLSLYEGIHGRPYQEFERDIIALEVGAVSALPCPFWRGDDCLIGGLGPHYNRAEESGRVPYGWLPTLVATMGDHTTYHDLVQQRAVADAKIALLTRNEALVL